MPAVQFLGFEVFRIPDVVRRFGGDGLAGIDVAFPWVPWHRSRFAVLSRLKPLLQNA